MIYWYITMVILVIQYIHSVLLLLFQYWLCSTSWKLLYIPFKVHGDCWIAYRLKKIYGRRTSQSGWPERNIHISNDNGYLVPQLRRCFLSRITVDNMSNMVQKLGSLLEHLCLPRCFLFFLFCFVVHLASCLSLKFTVLCCFTLEIKTG